jgi:hypothetical protein
MMGYNSREYYKKQYENISTENRQLEKKLNEAETRKRLAGQYLQLLRLAPVFSGDKGDVTELDFDRLTRILEVDDFPEGI